MIPQAFQALINQSLTGFFQQKLKPVVPQDGRLKLLIDQIADVTLRGGDRLRPYCCLLGYQAGRGKNEQLILPTMTALELTQSFALIHDDILDQASTRRGGPTIHAYFTKNLRNPDLGRSLAILAGDLCLVWAEELMDKIVWSNSTYKHLYHQMLEELAIGQILDSWGMRGKSTKDILQMYQLKSGNYSIEKPLLIGYALAGADSKISTALAKYGQALGLAFQLKDDLLGLFGKENKIGKSVISDLVEGKWTYQIACLYQKLSPKDKHKLLDVLGNKQAKPDQLDGIKQQLITKGVKTQVERLMLELVLQAKKSLVGVDLPNAIQMNKLADFVIQRSV